MNLACLLSFYDERSDWLRELVASLPMAGVTHLVVCDGAYDRYPGGLRQSPDIQHKALVRECKRQGIGLTVHIPDSTWPTEMAKRTHLFQLGETVTTDTDWFMVMDSDQVLQRVPADLHQRLENTHLDCALVTFDEPNPERQGRRFEIPILFRARRGITVEGNHYTYKTPDGVDLWGKGPCQLGLPLEMEVLHRTNLRPKARKAAAQTYYRARDADSVEIGRCVRCAGKGIEEIPSQWERADPPEGMNKRRGYLSAKWVAVCLTCKPILLEENRQTIASHGLNPAKVQMTHHIA